MSTETLVEPKLGDAPPCWPPVQHIHDKRTGPLKEGALALCGEKLMGVFLSRIQDARGKVCERCVEIFKQGL